MYGKGDGSLSLASRRFLFFGDALMNCLSGAIRLESDGKEAPGFVTLGMEANMTMTTTETMVIDILRREGTHTLESLWLRSGLDWVQVFAAIDHLSRSGEVSLRRASGRHYHILLKEA